LGELENGPESLRAAIHLRRQISNMAREKVPDDPYEAAGEDAGEEGEKAPPEEIREEATEIDPAKHDLGGHIINFRIANIPLPKCRRR
jgi:hypothetical protein